MRNAPAEPADGGWSVYIVRCGDDTLYTGVAKDVAARLEAHNSGKGAAYTRARRPVALVYREDGLSRSGALVREAAVKRLARSAKERLLKLAALAACALSLLASAASAVPVWTKEAPPVLSSATPLSFSYANATTFAYPLRMYYVRRSSQVEVLEAQSADGISWTELGNAGARVSTGTVPSVSASSITGASVMPLGSGGFRMFYSIESTTGAFRIHSATTAGAGAGVGFAWANDTGTRIEIAGGADYVTSPSVVALTDGSWRMYYVGDFNGGDQAGDRRVFSTRSTDEGSTWSAPAIVVSTIAYQVGASRLTDGKVRLFFTQPVAGASSATLISSALSTDANASSFSLETGFRLTTATGAGFLDGVALARATDTFRWRLYYEFDPDLTSTGPVHTALTGAPDPQRITPATALRTSSSGTYTITGEIFSPTPSAALTQVGTTLNGFSVTRADDMTITASFNTLAAALGPYNVVVGNVDGSSGTASAAFLIDTLPGTVALRGNLLRPRENVPVSISVTTYAAGRGSLKVYDADGRPVRTLFDGDLAEGNTVYTWDGRDSNGAVAPSGVYVLHARGNRLDNKSKIVLIR